MKQVKFTIKGTITLPDEFLLMPRHTSPDSLSLEFKPKADGPFEKVTIEQVSVTAKPVAVRRARR